MNKEEKDTVTFIIEIKLIKKNEIHSSPWIT